MRTLSEEVTPIQKRDMYVNWETSFVGKIGIHLVVSTNGTLMGLVKN